MPTPKPAQPPSTALATIPHGLPFTEDEWGAMSSVEQQEAMIFFREETAATTEGVQVQFPTVRFPTSGSSFFEIPSVTGEPEAAKEIEGTIVFKMPKRAFWASDEISNTPPTCSSRDGRLPVDGEGKQAMSCDACPHSKFGTATKGHGQRCKMRLDLFLVRPGDEIPTRMSLPPTGIKPFGAYAVGLRQKKSALIAVTTVISLQDAKNQDGVSYKAPTFRIGKALTFVQMKEARALSDAFENAMAERGITVEDTRDEQTDGVIEA